LIPLCDAVTVSKFRHNNDGRLSNPNARQWDKTSTRRPAEKDKLGAVYQD
jgi:hypothetical protein